MQQPSLSSDGGDGGGKRLRSKLSISSTNALEHFGFLRESAFRDHQLVIFLDYDGTLTPIVNNPEQAFLTSATIDLLKQLQRHFCTGIISGRSLAKLRQFVPVDGLYFAGSHGFDIIGPSEQTLRNQVAADFLPILAQARAQIQTQIAHIPGATVEDNLFSVSVHYRNVQEGLVATIEQIVDEVLRNFPKLRRNCGKKVFELKPKIEWNKGKAIIWLLEALKIDERNDVFTIYIGDDTTDEDAFEVLNSCRDDRHKGLGILVTESSMTTNATFTLRDSDEVRMFLSELIEFDRSRRGEKSLDKL